VVDWSWDLLSASEQVLARRLAVFPGGATLTAAEYVGADELLPPAAVLPALSGLVDKSILGVAEGPDGLSPRYRMLETVRAYGLERLAEAGRGRRGARRVRRVLPGPGRDRRPGAARGRAGPLAA
jgi:Predicted ATPase